MSTPSPAWCSSPCQVARCRSAAGTGSLLLRMHHAVPQDLQCTRPQSWHLSAAACSERKDTLTALTLSHAKTYGLHVAGAGAGAALCRTQSRRGGSLHASPQCGPGRPRQADGGPAEAYRGPSGFASLHVLPTDLTPLGHSTHNCWPRSISMLRSSSRYLLCSGGWQALGQFFCHPSLLGRRSPAQSVRRQSSNHCLCFQDGHLQVPGTQQPATCHNEASTCVGPSSCTQLLKPPGC